MVDLTIPADVAKQIAEFQRSTDGHPDDNAAAECWADLLDPQPPTLREQVYDVLISEPRGALERTDAVLTIMADWLAAQPLTEHAELCSHAHIERRNDVARIRNGGAS